MARLAVILFLLFAGCATYADKVRAVDDGVLRGDNAAALAAINDALGVDSKRDLPKDFEKDRALLLLERATVLQALGDYELSARDFVYADQYMAWLDISNQTTDNLVRYLYSGHAATYRAPPYERLLMNCLNMVNFLAMGNFQGAKVEARRFLLLESFFANDPELLPSSIRSFGHILAGVAFEGGRNYRQAAFHYDQAWKYGYRDSDFLSRVRALNGAVRFTPQSSELKPTKSTLEQYRAAFGKDVVIVSQTGLVPRKKAQIVPIITARRYSGYSGDIVGLNGINFPLMVPAFDARSSILSIDGKRRTFDTTFNVSRAVTDGYQRSIPKLMTAAITRAVAREAVGAGTRAAVKDEGWGTLLSLLITGGLTLNDRPDTRSWTTLPASINVSWIKGAKKLSVDVGGRTEIKNVKTNDGVRLMNFSRHR